MSMEKASFLDNSTFHVRGNLSYPESYKKSNKKTEYKKI